MKNSVKKATVAKATIASVALIGFAAAFCQLLLCSEGAIIRNSALSTTFTVVIYTALIGVLLLCLFFFAKGEGEIPETPKWVYWLFAVGFLGQSVVSFFEERQPFQATIYNTAAIFVGVIAAAMFVATAISRKAAPFAWGVCCVWSLLVDLDVVMSTVNITSFQSRGAKGLTAIAILLFTLYMLQKESGTKANQPLMRLGIYSFWAISALLVLPYILGIFFSMKDAVINIPYLVVLVFSIYSAKEFFAAK